MSVTKRAKVWSKTNGHCAFCGKSIIRESGKPNSMTIDHFVPKVFLKLYRPDNTDISVLVGNQDNMIPLCHDCNAKKGDLLINPIRVDFTCLNHDAKNDLMSFYASYVTKEKLLSYRSTVTVVGNKIPIKGRKKATVNDDEERLLSIEKRLTDNEYTLDKLSKRIASLEKRLDKLGGSNLSKYTTLKTHNKLASKVNSITSGFCSTKSYNKLLHRVEVLEGVVGKNGR